MEKFWEENYKVSVQSICDQITPATKLIYIANPNNPTGSYLTKKDLRELISKVPNHIIVVIDGAYAEYVQEEDYDCDFSLVKEFENVICTRTFSKVYGLASLRVGWGYGNKKIIDALNVIKPPFNVNELAQKAAVESLRDTKFISRSIKHNILYATKLKLFLQKYGITSNKVSANFLLLNFKKCKFKAKYFNEKLKNKGIILRSTEDGYKIKNMLRLTIGSKKDNFRFMSAVKSMFNKWKIY